jgi:hypothetical protein
VIGCCHLSFAPSPSLTMTAMISLPAETSSAFASAASRSLPVRLELVRASGRSCACVEPGYFGLARHESDSWAWAWAVGLSRGPTRHDTIGNSVGLGRHEVHRGMRGPCQGRARRLEWTYISVLDRDENLNDSLVDTRRLFLS